MANQDRTGQRARAGRSGQARTRGAAAGRATRGATAGRAAKGAAAGRATRGGTAGRATRGGTAAGRAQAAQRRTATARADAATEQADAAAERHGRTLTITIPERAADIAMLPVAAGRRVLTARNGLPVYVGLGVLAVADVIELPVAAAVGAGYAALRRWGPLRPAREVPGGGQARSSSGNGEK